MTDLLNFIACNLPMLICFITGVVLIVMEAFMPGFGLPGISGVVLEIVALVLAWFNLGPAATLGLLLIILSLLAISVSLSLRSVAKGRLNNSAMVLKDSESEYRSNNDMDSFVGLVGTSTTVLRPTGNAEFDGVKLNVVTEGDFIPAGTQVKVIRVEGSRILVRPV